MGIVAYGIPILPSLPIRGYMCDYDAPVAPRLSSAIVSRKVMTFGLVSIFAHWAFSSGVSAPFGRLMPLDGRVF